MVAILSLQNISKGFVLKNITCQIGQKINSGGVNGGGICLLMGENGSGKTTLLRILHNIEAGKGKIIWQKKSYGEKRNRSFVFQTPIIMQRNVLANIIYPEVIRGGGKAGAIKKAQKLAKMLGLEGKLEMAAGNLSGGERQKMALARALITSPKILLLDEPTANIDEASTKAIESLLKKIAKKGTHIIMASHNIRQARRIASEIIFMQAGRVVESGRAKTILNNPKSKQARNYFK